MRQSPAQEAGPARRLAWGAKTAVKGAVWRSLETTGLHRWLAPLRGSTALVLYYRAVFADDYDLPIEAENVVTTENFHRQMTYLKQHRTVLALEECFEYWLRHGKPPQRSAVVTFDDGFACCREVAAPVLRDLGLPATFFVIPGYTETETPKWDDLLRQLSDPFDKWIIRSTADELRAEVARLLREKDSVRVQDVSRRLCRGMLTFSQMRELVDMGFSVQSHSLEHWYLASQTREVQAREIGESKRILERELRRPVEFFSVPFGYPGSFDRRTVELLREFGYRGAFGGNRGYLTRRSDRFAMPRVVVHAGVPFKRFRLAVSGAMV